MRDGVALTLNRHFVHQVQMPILVRLIGQPNPRRGQIQKHELAGRIGDLPGQPDALRGGS